MVLQSFLNAVSSSVSGDEESQEGCDVVDITESTINSAVMLLNHLNSVRRILMSFTSNNAPQQKSIKPVNHYLKRFTHFVT